MELLVDCVWNVMAHAQKPDFVFWRNGRVHLNRQGRQFSRLLAAKVCASAVVMLHTPSSEVVWRVLATHSIHQFPLHFPSRASPCAITFQTQSTSVFRTVQKGFSISANLISLSEEELFLILLCRVVCIVFTSARTLSSHRPMTCNKFNKQGENYYRFRFEVLRSFPGSVVHRAPPAHTEDTPLLLHPCERDRRLLDGMLLIGTSRPCLNARVWRHQYI